MRVVSFQLLIAMVAFGFLTACQTTNPDGTLVVDFSPEPDYNKNPSTFAPSDDLVAKGRVHLHNGDYGTAESLFRKAVEQTPNDVDAWLGLAASYDHLRRWEFADRAYQHVYRLVGKNAAIMNNIGYSYLLRGDMVKARRAFLAALDAEPNNTRILRNIELLDARTAHVGPDPRKPAYIGTKGEYPDLLQPMQLSTSQPQNAPATTTRTAAVAPPPKRANRKPAVQKQAKVKTQRVATLSTASPAVVTPNSAPAETALPPSPASGRFEVQIGAFPTEAIAVSKLGSARALGIAYLNGRATRTIRHERDGNTYHRARFSGFTRSDAREACSALKDKGTDCYVVDPKG